MIKKIKTRINTHIADCLSRQPQVSTTVCGPSTPVIQHIKLDPTAALTLLLPFPSLPTLKASDMGGNGGLLSRPGPYTV